MFFAPALRATAFISPRAFDRSFERFARSALLNDRQRPDVEQDDTSWTLRLDVPGVAREDLSVSVEGAVVRIATRTEAARPFKAAYELPQDIDAATSEVKLENGVLTLKLGKLAPVSHASELTIG